MEGTAYMYKSGYQVRVTTRAYTLGATKPLPPIVFPSIRDQYNLQPMEVQHARCNAVEGYLPLNSNQCSSSANNRDQNSLHRYVLQNFMLPHFPLLAARKNLTVIYVMLLCAMTVAYWMLCSALDAVSCRKMMHWHWPQKHGCCS